MYVNPHSCVWHDPVPVETRRKRWPCPFTGVESNTCTMVSTGSIGIHQKSCRLIYLELIDFIMGPWNTKSLKKMVSWENSVTYDHCFFFFYEVTRRLLRNSLRSSPMVKSFIIDSWIKRDPVSRSLLLCHYLFYLFLELSFSESMNIFA